MVSGHKGIKSIGAGTGDLGVLPTHETSSLFGVHYGEDAQPLPLTLPNTPSVSGRSFIDKHYPLYSAFSPYPLSYEIALAHLTNP